MQVTKVTVPDYVVDFTLALNYDVSYVIYLDTYDFTKTLYNRGVDYDNFGHNIYTIPLLFVSGMTNKELHDKVQKLYDLISNHSWCQGKEIFMVTNNLMYDIQGAYHYIYVNFYTIGGV